MLNLTNNHKRNWKYLPLAYAILLTIVLTIISVADFEPLSLKILSIVFAAVSLFWFCFFFGPFKRLVFRIMTKSQQDND